MSFLLDTNVVSEWIRPQPNAGVINWLHNVDEDRVYLSVVTFTEIRYGIARLAAGARRKRLEDWLQRELPLRFEGRILTIDQNIADAGGRMVARSERAGRPMVAIDAYRPLLPWFTS